ncbi:hypothetical protein [Streptomonospora wellingtoniae]|uniref:DUF3558 domain-containing protein n=1 Tax=Streptomonospora wellingtoniae TaxID=3075544 RepID=A0ABU2L0I3_9ACTN|nr:hypothetical protein [Streptomonospora sp. DSM 45055]MDT0304843.1 hypothetical protein [Streptomonospora sp. DSM 45055]
MSEQPGTLRRNQGVRGWRAFFLMFGCGTTAALLVVGMFVGTIRMLGSAVAQGGESPMDGVSGGSWEPAPSMTAGALDLCSTLETSSQTGAFKSMFPKRLDEDDDYADPGPGSQRRMISDDCEWALISPDYGDWEMRLYYKASAVQGSEEARLDDARARFHDIQATMPGKFSELKGTEEVDDIGEQGFAQYGKPREGGSKSLYIFLGRSRSGVFRMDISSVSQEVPAKEFRQLTRSLAPVLATRIERILPA